MLEFHFHVRGANHSDTSVHVGTGSPCSTQMLGWFITQLWSRLPSSEWIVSEKLASELGYEYPVD